MNKHNQVGSKMQLFLAIDDKTRANHIKHLLNSSVYKYNITDLNFKKDNIILPPQCIVIVDEENYKIVIDQYVINFKHNNRKLIIILIEGNKDYTINLLEQKIIRSFDVNHDFNIPLKNGMLKIKSQDIFYFENINRYIYVHTKNKVIKTNIGLKQLKQIISYSLFESPYVSYYVNLSHIKKINKNEVHLYNNEKIILSQKKASNFRKKYEAYLSSLL